MRLLETDHASFLYAVRRPGKTRTVAWLYGLWVNNFAHGRIDSTGWPTRDAAAPEEDG